MKMLSFFDRRTAYSLSALGLLLGLAAPGLIPAYASAAQVTARSITLSNSNAGATGVSYRVQFTSVGAAGAFVVDFCNDSPIIGQTCTAPVGLSTASVTTPDGSTTVANSGGSRFIVTKTIGAASTITVNVAGITNPTSPTDGSGSNGLYARIVTYDTAGNAAGYTASSTTGGTGAVDMGGVALSITNGIGVTAAVRESMTFCVANVDIEPNCDNAYEVGNLPNIEIGEAVGAARALSPDAVSEASVFTQISTNAASGAVVNMKSDTTDCGGMKRIGATACDIGPAPLAGIAVGEAYFGVRTNTAAAATGAASPSGTLVPVTGSGYNNTDFYMDYTAGNTAGVTSTYGDPFIDTANAPANNQNMEVTFGASITNSTPAGLYAANISLIATGKF